MVVSGPGVVHGLAGLANAKENGWPMLLIGGASDTNQSQTMAFQESSQIEFVRPYVKYAARIDSIERAPFHIERAIRISLAGRPGPVYLDLPGDLVNSAPKQELLKFPPSRGLIPPKYMADPYQIDRAVATLASSHRPLIIIGEGAAYFRAENECLKLVEETGIPFLTAPMGKGVIPDDHSQNVIAARSTALLKADCVVLVATRLNWMLHFGLPPRFDPNVKIIQIDIDPVAMHDNVPSVATLCGTPTLVVEQLRAAMMKNGSIFRPLDGSEDWWKLLAKSVEENVIKSAELANDKSLPMNYYSPISIVQEVLAKDFRDAIIVSEGANTMDIGRTILLNYLPRSRLDAGIYGAMGPALGQAVAAQIVHPDRKVVCLLGDSSFGFSAMEIETLCRYRMPVVIVIISNSGIGLGVPIQGDTLAERLQGASPNSLGGGDEGRYDKMMQAFGGKGYNVEKHDDIEPYLRDALMQNVPSIINIPINPFAGRKQQKFDWLTRESKL